MKAAHCRNSEKKLYFARPSFVSALLRRDSALQEPDIQVGTPRRGSTQRMSTTYAIKNTPSQSHSGMILPSSFPSIAFRHQQARQNDQKPATGHFPFEWDTCLLKLRNQSGVLNSDGVKWHRFLGALAEPP
jgi:hypothetical protein